MRKSASLMSVVVAATTVVACGVAGRGAPAVPIVRLTFDGPGVANQFPQASPDGRYLVFQRCEKPALSKSVNGKSSFTFKEGADWDIYRMRIDGSERVRMTNSPEVEDEPAYSPDGRSIAYRGMHDGKSELFLMDADGRNKRSLFANATMDVKTPTFSPDGGRILFYADTGRTSSHVFSVDVAGGTLQQLTTGPYQDKHPQFTPDGAAVIFHSTRKQVEIPIKGQGKRSPLMGIFALTLKTGRIEPLLTAAGDELQDSRHSFVSRDGRFIVYHSLTFAADPGRADTYKRVREDIYVMTRDGKHRVNLTEHDARYFKHPSWSADGHGIYCVFNDKHGDDVWNVAYIGVTAALRELM